MSVELGYGLITRQRHPGDARSDRQLYAELARGAERLGFNSVWASGHHCVDDRYLPSVLPLSAAIAADHDALRISPGRWPRALR